MIEQQGAASGLLVRLANLSWCFAGGKPQLLRIAEAVSAALGEGSGISAGLTAAGYDMGPVLQGFEAIAAFYWGVFVTREHVRHNKSGIAHRGRTGINH
jgi:hypothetical protein